MRPTAAENVASRLNSHQPALKAGPDENTLINMRAATRAHNNRRNTGNHRLLAYLGAVVLISHVTLVFARIKPTRNMKLFPALTIITAH